MSSDIARSWTCVSAATPDACFQACDATAKHRLCGLSASVCLSLCVCVLVTAVSPVRMIIQIQMLMSLRETTPLVGGKHAHRQIVNSEFL